MACVTLFPTNSPDTSESSVDQAALAAEGLEICGLIVEVGEKVNGIDIGIDKYPSE